MLDAIRRLPPLPGVVGTEQSLTPQSAPKNSGKPDKQFGDVLSESLEENAPLSFSAHAQSRLTTRSIQLTSDQLARLHAGVNQAAQKGARESLVVMDNLAFIVSVPNRTVVTAVDGAAKSGNVFTQIDSAVLV